MQVLDSFIVFYGQTTDSWRENIDERISGTIPFLLYLLALDLEQNK